MPRLFSLTTYANTPITQPRAIGAVEEHASLEALFERIYDLGTDSGVKGSAGYVVAAPVSGPRSNASAGPTTWLALDYDDLPPGESPAWAALAKWEYLAYTTDSHRPGVAERWRVLVALDRPYDRDAVSAADVPASLVGCHLRAIAQPVYLPTRRADIEWVQNHGAPLRLTEEWAGGASAAPAWLPPAGPKRVPSAAATNALVARWLGVPEGTNRLAGAVGAVLADWGWSDEDVREYLTAWLSADLRLAKHTDDAVRGARKRRTGERIVGLPTLAAELGDGVWAPVAAAREDVSALLLEAAADRPAAASVSADVPTASASLFGARAYSAADIAAWVPPPIEWLSEALCLAPGAPGLITGYGGSGKTTFVQHLAVAVATPGGRLLGEHPVRHGSVLHLDHEQGQDLTRRRYLRLGLSAAADLTLVSFPRWSLADQSPEARGALVQAARGRALVVIDSLLASCAGFLEDGENASSVREPLDFLAQVSEATGAVFLVIHHSKKDRAEAMTAARGSSAITDAVSVHLTYEKADLRPGTQPTLELGKVRYEPPAGALSSATTVAFAPRGAPADGGYTLVSGGTPQDAADARRAALVVEAATLFQAGWTGSASALAERLGRRKADVLEVVAELTQDGIIVRGAGEGRGRLALAKA